MRERKGSATYPRGHFLAFNVQIFASTSGVILLAGKCEEAKGWAGKVWRREFSVESYRACLRPLRDPVVGARSSLAFTSSSSSPSPLHFPLRTESCSPFYET